jgi:hypothetical protein
MTAHPHELSAEAARRLTLATDPWLSCEGCFDRMDAFVEAVLAGSPAADDAAMRAHLAGCPACAEELESLLVLVAEEAGTDGVAALRRLHGSRG